MLFYTGEKPVHTKRPYDRIREAVQSKKKQTHFYTNSWILQSTGFTSEVLNPFCYNMIAVLVWWHVYTMENFAKVKVTRKSFFTILLEVKINVVLVKLFSYLSHPKTLKPDLLRKSLPPKPKHRNLEFQADCKYWNYFKQPGSGDKHYNSSTRLWTDA